MGNQVRIRNGMTNATEGDIIGMVADLIENMGVVDLTTHLKVTPNSPVGMSVKVAGGIVYVPNGNYSELDSDTPKYYPVVGSDEVLTIDNNTSGSTRIDLVCIKVDKVLTPDPDASNIATKVVVKGTPGSGTPTTPSNHYKLAEITVVNGATSINTAQIVDKRQQVKLKGSFVSVSIDSSANTGGKYGSLSGTINGTNKLFTVSAGRYMSGRLKVFLNGQLLTVGSGNDFTETNPANGTFTFVNAPISGDIIIVEY